MTMTNLEDQLDRLDKRIDRLVEAYYKALTSQQYSRCKAIAATLRRLEEYRVEERYFIKLTEISTFKKLEDKYPYQPPVAAVVVKSAVRKPRAKKETSS